MDRPATISAPEATSIGPLPGVVGMDVQVPCIDGVERPYVNLDNAATTPPLKEVAETLHRFEAWYSSVHRGTGYKSQLSTEVYEEARRIIGEFVGIDRSEQIVMFTQHTTDAINRLARRFPLKKSDLVLSTVLEHHANMIPWAQTDQVVHVGLDEDGVGLDLESIRVAFAEYAGRIRLLAVTGASNVTGYMPPIHELAEIAHQNGALIFVDAAQLAPHRPIDLRPAGDPGHIDFLALSAHKMYAPYGAGILVGPIRVFAKGTPAVLGGGAVDAVALDRVLWTDLPEREEAGTPNMFGVVALARACQVLRRFGMERVAEHEREISRYALRRLGEVEGLRMAGDSDPALPRDRVAVFTFAVDGYYHAELAAILGFEYGIAVRNGCFCAHPYVKILAHVREEEDARMWAMLAEGDHSQMPGFVRASAGCYTTQADIDTLVEALHTITRDGPAAVYRQVRETGEYFPEGYEHTFGDRFHL